MVLAISVFKSDLLIMTLVLFLNWVVTSRVRFKSCNPESVGSVTITTSSTPVMVEITGQPIPGGPSIMIVSIPFSLATFLALLRTISTKRPEFSSPGESRPYTILPLRNVPEYILLSSS